MEAFENELVILDNKRALVRFRQLANNAMNKGLFVKATFQSHNHSKSLQNKNALANSGLMSVISLMAQL